MHRDNLLLPHIRAAKTKLKQRSAQVPDGWEHCLPDFVGVGTQRGGTTWWFSQLLTHEKIVLPPKAPKEQHFFDSALASSKSVDSLRQLYSLRFSKPPGAITGEWTPRYLSDWWVPPLLASVIPLSKILVLLRDPIERFTSGWLHSYSRRHLGFADSASDAIYRSMYGCHLRRLLHYIHSDLVLVQQYEYVIRTPGTALRAAHAFLGAQSPNSFETAYNVRHKVPKNESRQGKIPLSDSAYESLLLELRSDIATLIDMLPEFDFDLWPTVQALRQRSLI